MVTYPGAGTKYSPSYVTRCRARATVEGPADAGRGNLGPRPCRNIIDISEHLT